MSKKYQYGQPVYGQEIHYQTGIDTNYDQMAFQGAEYGTYETTNYQHGAKTNMTNNEHILQQTYEQPIYLDQNQTDYTQQVFYQGGQPNQVYEYQQQGEQILGYEDYYQIPQQNQQQFINQNYQQPQPQTIAQQQAQQARISQQQSKMAQQQAKIVRQIVQPKQNIQAKQNIQPTSGSRNPHMRQQYQYQQNQQIQQQNIPQNIQGKMNKPQRKPNFVENAYIQQDQFDDKPQIESDFQPEIPMTNSVLSQSKIPFQPKESQVPQMNPQVNQPPTQSKIIPQQSQQYPGGYVIPRRNPNLNIKQYQYNNNDSHFVTSVDPGTRTMGYNPQEQNPSQIQTKTSQNLSKKVSGEMSNKQSKISQKSIEANIEPNQNEKEYADQLFYKTEEPGVDTGKSNINPTVGLSGIQNSGMKDVELNLNENLVETKFPNEEIEKENPIEEKVPDQSNVDNLNNENDNFPQEENQNQFGGSQMEGDIDDNLDHLPTINSIMKGTSNMLPPPKKKKYS